MDNKRVYKKISTLFWFMLASIPFWYSVLSTLFMWFAHIDSISDISSINTFFSNNFISYFISFTSNLNQFLPSFLKNTFNGLLQNLSINNASPFASAMSWFCWIYFIELMIDFVVWLPKLIHSFMERWCAD